MNGTQIALLLLSYAHRSRNQADGLRASHNLIHHAPHSAIVYGGPLHRFDYNEIHNVCQESHDCGAIYGGRSWCMRGDVFEHNYLHHLTPGRSGLDCRDFAGEAGARVRRTEPGNLRPTEHVPWERTPQPQIIRR